MQKEDVSVLIDQFSAREACAVLAALRVFQQVRAAGGKIPPYSTHKSDPYCSTLERMIDELEHFEDAAQLSDSEIDVSADRIVINWPDDSHDRNSDHTEG